MFHEGGQLYITLGDMSPPRQGERKQKMKLKMKKEVLKFSSFMAPYVFITVVQSTPSIITSVNLINNEIYLTSFQTVFVGTFRNRTFVVY